MLRLIASSLVRLAVVFFFNDPAPTEIYTLSLHDALPISAAAAGGARRSPRPALPRLPHRRPRRRRRGSLSRQLDLHPRARRSRRPDPELPLVVPVDGPRPRQGVRRPGVLLLRGRRPLYDGR